VYGSLELLQDHRGDLFGGVRLPQDLHLDATVLSLDHLVRHDRPLALDFLEAAAHEALDRINRVLGVDGCLAAGQGPDQALIAPGKRDHRRRRPSALRIGDYDGFAALHHGDDAVGRPQVDSYCLSHKFLRS